MADDEDRILCSRHVQELVAAIEHVHRSGFVIGDLEPRHLRLDKQNRAFIIDFGFAVPIGARLIGACRVLRCLKTHTFV